MIRSTNANVLAVVSFSQVILVLNLVEHRFTDAFETRPRYAEIPTCCAKFCSLKTCEHRENDFKAMKAIAIPYDSRNGTGIAALRLTR